MQAQPWEWGIKETPAREWTEGMGSLIAVAMFLGGIAGGLYLASLYFNNIWGMFIGWIFALGMRLFDMAHLKKPTRVWRIAFRPGSSWISRGFIFVILFIGAAGIQLLLHLLTGAPASEPGVAELFFRVVAGILAFGVAIYSGFVISFVSGIKFWNSALLPVLVVIGGLAGGAAILLAITAYTADPAFAVVQGFARFILVFYAVAIFIHLWISTYSSQTAKDSAISLLKGDLPGIFWLVIILIGIVVPLALDFTMGINSTVPFIVSAVLVLSGFLALRYTILKAGRYTPLVPA